MKKWTFAMLLIALALFGSVIVFNIMKQKGIAEYMANRPEPEFPVTVVDIKTSDWIPTIQAIGFIEPNQGVNIANEVAGKIDSITFDSGTKVTKGQLLVSLDSDVEKANLKSSQAKLNAAKSKFLRYEALYKKNAVSKEALDESEASYSSLLADIESQKATIARRQITAPFDGDIGLRNVFLGEYLSAGTSIVRLEDTSVMRLRFTVPQTQISKVYLGQEVEIFVDAYPETVFNGKISAIEPAVNYQSGLIQIQADIPNNKSQLRSGMFARANVILPTIKDQITVPQTAITFTLYGDNVYLVREDENGDLRVTQSVVKVGERIDAIAHILEGVKAGDKIVTSGQVRLSNHAKVRIIENDTLKVPVETPML
ncbi:efflux RND transporter periplasmic adaptor subunit [Moritella yayanosii]|uniref:Efflux transporter periplasmic adaptor subunit n=1 Tax=Moritella yayanosii TaxID=69539 RepID=A0A330LN33_9GAMM|nr:efflux RND transporter periplasmic adaptor subunit [Moritella yayanosii]SQD77391.1 Efflux transporter periplasmic adaptor subunit [Moritella yayanosii]